jgi:hypothetical protein
MDIGLIQLVFQSGPFKNGPGFYLVFIGLLQQSNAGKCCPEIEPFTDPV